MSLENDSQSEYFKNLKQSLLKRIDRIKLEIENTNVDFVKFNYRNLITKLEDRIREIERKVFK